MATAWIEAAWIVTVKNTVIVAAAVVHMRDHRQALVVLKGYYYLVAAVHYRMDQYLVVHRDYYSGVVDPSLMEVYQVANNILDRRSDREDIAGVHHSCFPAT